MTIDQISVFVENKAGRLAEITKIIGDANLDMRAMCIADTADFGILRIIVNDPARALETLRAADCVVSVTPVLAVKIEDRPGSLADVLGALAGSGISVEYLYAFMSRRKEDAYVVLRVEDYRKAAAALAENGIVTATQAELYEQ